MIRVEISKVADVGHPCTATASRPINGPEMKRREQKVRPEREQIGALCEKEGCGGKPHAGALSDSSRIALWLFSSLFVSVVSLTHHSRVHTLSPSMTSGEKTLAHQGTPWLSLHFTQMLCARACVCVIMCSEPSCQEAIWRLCPQRVVRSCERRACCAAPARQGARASGGSG